MLDRQRFLSVAPLTAGEMMFIVEHWESRTILRVRHPADA
jgi:hypothetical protein